MPGSRDAAQRSHRKRRRLTELGSEAREEVSHHAGSVREERPSTGVGGGETRDETDSLDAARAVLDRLYRLLLPILV